MLHMARVAAEHQDLVLRPAFLADGVHLAWCCRRTMLLDCVVEIVRRSSNFGYSLVAGRMERGE